MVFECANRMLHWICMVIIGISELILEILGGDGCTHAVGDLIVNFAKDGIDTSGLQFRVASIVVFDEVFCLSTLGWVDEDCIGIMIVE